MTISIISIISSFLMGVYGSPHCIIMCGNTCNLINKKNTLIFHISRIIGYGVFGFLAASFFNYFNMILRDIAFLHSLRFIFQIIIILWGGYMLIYGRQPVFLNSYSSRLWETLKNNQNKGVFTSIYGLFWVFIPCSLIYAALAIAMLTNSGINGFIVMVAFGFGTMLPMLGYSVLWNKMVDKKWTYEIYVIKIFGLTLIIFSILSLIKLLDKNLAWILWCV